MAELEIQVNRGADWLKVTSFRYSDKRSRAATVLAAFLGLSQWRDSDQFTGRPVRVAERTGGYGAAAYREIRGIAG
ncbi:MAG: hypothetical protein JWR80_7980 [Bradyrhizobium sp.]|nr:hypothetical protein [Bradyrhizobium sp.]